METASYILVTDRLGNSKRHPLDKPKFTLGRHADNDLQILSTSVSRYHAEIIFEDGAFYIVDMGSKSGTFVNGQFAIRRRLCDSDRIRLGGDEENEIQFADAGQKSVAAGQESGSEPAQAPFFNARAELENLAKFLEVNQALKVSLSIDEVLRLIVDAAVEITGAERGALLLRGARGELEFRVARDRDRRTLARDSFSISRTAVDQALKGGRGVIVSDLTGDNPLAGMESARDMELRKIVCIPLERFRVRERTDATGIFSRDVLGTLYVDSRQATDALSKTSITLLESLAFEASKALESLRLMLEEEQKQRMEREFAMAREVQVALLTNSTLVAGHVEVAAQSTPSRYVDGDFYDLFLLEDGRCVIVLGDVAGKGIAAALLASMTQGILEAQLRAGHGIAAAISIVNRMLVRKSASSKFVTLFCAVLDETGDLSFVNAGHNPPVLLRSGGELETLSSNGMVVGAFDFAAYAEGQTRIGPGDVLVAFTDGVTEAIGGTGEMFGEQRLASVIRAAAPNAASEIRDAVLAQVAAFTHGLPQEDDITIVALKMKS
jgi:sigma-B regulation protein RsbU (phosphoserine phosphatase)